MRLYPGQRVLLHGEIGEGLSKHRVIAIYKRLDGAILVRLRWWVFPFTYELERIRHKLVAVELTELILKEK